ncbi:MAG: hypothetical protein ACTSYB_04245, partial [Candidatus Helarchaeota archaeon]
MGKQFHLVSTFLLLTIMLNMTWIDAKANSLEIYADLRVNKPIGDVGEELIFYGGNTTGPWGELIFLF